MSTAQQRERALELAISSFPTGVFVSTQDLRDRAEAFEQHLVGEGLTIGEMSGSLTGTWFILYYKESHRSSEFRLQTPFETARAAVEHGKKMLDRTKRGIGSVVGFRVVPEVFG